MKYNILLADDDASIRFVLSKSLTKAGFNVRATDNVQTLLKWVRSGDGDVILTDVHMDTDDIFTFVPEITKLRPELPIIIMSANTSVATALKSGNAGVFDYIPKPFDLKHLEHIIRRAVDKNSGGSEKPLARSVEAIAEPIIGKSTVLCSRFFGEFPITCPLTFLFSYMGMWGLVKIMLQNLYMPQAHERLAHLWYLMIALQSIF